jgi:uncharacterized protein (TIGR00369 family)
MPEPGLSHVPNCYGCGPQNPLGLKMTFRYLDDHIVGEFHSREEHVGPPGIVHGGLIAALIDESFSVLCRGLLGQEARTIKAEIHFRKPAPTGSTLQVKTVLDKETDRALLLTSSVYLTDTLIADAKGTMFKIKKTH